MVLGCAGLVARLLLLDERRRSSTYRGLFGEDGVETLATSLAPDFVGEAKYFFKKNDSGITRKIDGKGIVQFRLPFNWMETSCNNGVLSETLSKIKHYYPDIETRGYRIVNSYIECVYVPAPDSNTSGFEFIDHSSADWHMDAIYPSFKVSFALSETNQRNGSTEYLKRSNRFSLRKVYLWIHSYLKRLSYSATANYNDLKKYEVHQVHLKVGQGAIMETGLGWHRRVAGIASNKRLTLWCEIVPNPN